MAGMAAAWRLSEPGWRDRFDTITVYQRGWRLGGKGASSRGPHGRIEEHGLHLWLGFYENAFRLLRECYAELDRPTTDPLSPIRTWREALQPAAHIGLEDRDGDDWQHWLAVFTPNDLEPGGPLADARSTSAAEYVRRALRLILDFVDALPSTASAHGGGVVLSPSPEAPRPSPVATMVAGTRVVVPAALLEATRLIRAVLERPLSSDQADPRLAGALDDLQARLAALVAAEPALRRGWQHISLSIALVRGLVADGVVADPGRLAGLDDEDFLAWIARHGAARDAVDGAFLRGMYDLVLAYADGDPARPAFAAGTAVLITVRMLLEYNGALFWRMTAGMGDVVFAPLYEALCARGVDVEFFHRVDELHLSPDLTCVDAISMGRQVRLRDGLDRYQPLVSVQDLACFPDAPLVDQLSGGDGIVGQPLESHWCVWPDAERPELRRGRDFDIVVLAIPIGMAGTVCAELVADRPEWRDMVANVATVATQSAQLWLAEDEPTLGWPHPGATVSAFTTPFDTWASMPQLIAREDWPTHDRPRSIAYFCSVLDAPWPAAERTEAGPATTDPAYPEHHRQRVGAHLVRFLERDVGHLLPGAVRDGRFRWDLLCGREGRMGREALDSQYWTANVDPADRYVQSLPGTARYRLRPDESGYDNLFLAGDWTDSGLNAGCIEAAVLSGLQAANAVLGRARNHRVTAYDLG
jgi:uncharacterized protein with NAD-binding domain and iron-sulfur cluster